MNDVAIENDVKDLTATMDGLATSMGTIGDTVAPQPKGSAAYP
jgi:hypothetical protein